MCRLEINVYSWVFFHTGNGNEDIKEPTHGSDFANFGHFSRITNIYLPLSIHTHIDVCLDWGQMIVSRVMIWHHSSERQCLNARMLCSLWESCAERLSIHPSSSNSFSPLIPADSLKAEFVNWVLCLCQAAQSSQVNFSKVISCTNETISCTLNALNPPPPHLRIGWFYS